MDALEHAISLDPTMKKARLLLATAYTDSGKPDGAIRTLQDGIRLSPDSPDLMVSLEKLIWRQDGCLTQKPNSVRPFPPTRTIFRRTSGLLPSYRRQRGYPQAIAESTQILVAEPKSFNALLERGISFYESGIRKLPVGISMPFRRLSLAGPRDFITWASLTSTKNATIRLSPI